MNKRKLNEKLYNQYYKRFGNNWSKCIYCGLSATLYDHCPPISKIENINIKKFIKDGNEFLLYPSCKDCNSFLNASMNIDLFERMNFLFDKYTEKANHYDNLWDKNEIEQLGPNLKSIVLLNFKKFQYYQNMANRVQNQITERFYNSETA